MGNVMKLKVIYDIRIRKSLKQSDKQNSSVIISLTSYGDRVNECVVYTIHSLLKQDIRAERIVLWLDTSFQDATLSHDLMFLKQYGLDIRYCEDIRSYKKIIPSLKNFPDKHIVTVDDDIYYPSDMLSSLIETHQHHPGSVVCRFARTIPFGDKNEIKPYNQWIEHTSSEKSFSQNGVLLFPVGVGGVFYPAHVFDEEVVNQQVFMSLCPKADDVWLYIMELRLGIDKQLSTVSSYRCYQTDAFRQYFSRDSLTSTNRFEGENDQQLIALLDYYNIKLTAV